MTFGKLYGPPKNPRNLKVIVTAKYANLELELTPDFSIKESTKTQEYLSKFPLGQCPGFEDTEGNLIIESNAICFHIAQQASNLLGKDHLELTKIIQYILFDEAQIICGAPYLLAPIFNMKDYIPELGEEFMIRLIKALKYLNGEIQGKKYLVGDHISLADICIVSDISLFFKFILSSEDRNDIPELVRYFQEIRNEPIFKELMGDVVFAEKRFKF